MGLELIRDCKIRQLIEIIGVCKVCNKTYTIIMSEETFRKWMNAIPIRQLLADKRQIKFLDTGECCAKTTHSRV